MTPRKLDLFIATYSYGGNGNIASTTPHVMYWLVDLIQTIQHRKDSGEEQRIGHVTMLDYCDTPITMTRNRTVLDARSVGADLLLQIDSDMHPDMYASQGAKPFFDAAFDFIYENYDKGPHVVGAPYTGPPPARNVYVFQWGNLQWNFGQPPSPVDMQLKQYSREEAARMAGVQEAAALPTGLILWDMRCFDLTEPKEKGDNPWFFYEWGNDEYDGIYQASKASTEDVTATREVSLAGCQKLGYNPVYCAWSSWAGHIKQETSGKPDVLCADSVSKNLANAVLSGVRSDQRQIHFRSPLMKAIEEGRYQHDGNGESEVTDGAQAVQ